MGRVRRSAESVLGGRLKVRRRPKREPRDALANLLDEQSRVPRPETRSPAEVARVEKFLAALTEKEETHEGPTEE
jgi:hypothetical protein